MLHFTPTSSSWLDLVERWFRELTTNRLRRGVFPRRVSDLVAMIYAVSLRAGQRGDSPASLSCLSLSALIHLQTVLRMPV
ncbi:MAG: hypothetical protein C0498_02135 [Anaerolinea sp.]|nr:hypothetical protein [Anaerolinea sp.]